jgi:hypothetical protein
MAAAARRLNAGAESPQGATSLIKPKGKDNVIKSRGNFAWQTNQITGTHQGNLPATKTAHPSGQQIVRQLLFKTWFEAWAEN